jgi:predicted MFS family arabinose efflux permease
MSSKIHNEKSFILSKTLVLIMAAAGGIVVANLYYAQPLLSEIARTFKVSEGSIGIVAMLTQMGYATGMFFILPLGDIRERRGLIVLMLYLAAGALLLMSMAFNLPILLFAAFAVGFTSVVPQLIVPLAAQLANPRDRGKIIGTVMSGLLIGILLSRTFSGIIGGAFGWRVVYIIGTTLMILLATLLKVTLPVTKSTSSIPYSELIKSLWGILKSEKVLREASINGAMMFATFSAFWTSLIFLLESPVYKLGPQAAGLFGLVGVGGALTSPLVGRLADKKSPRFTVGIAVLISTLAYICFWTLGFKIWGLVIGVIFLDLGTQSGLVSNQSRTQALNAEKRNRINTIFMVSYFLGGSLGSILGAYNWAHYGWTGVCITGFIFQLIAIIAHITRR